MGFKISEEDKKLFREAVEKIKSEKPLTGRKNEEQSSQRASWRYALSDMHAEDVGPEAILSYTTPGFPSKRFQDLKNGRVRWEAKLDLHGIRFDSAADILCQAIEQYSEQNIRMVLIIHGKGGRFGKVPILKNHVNHWLKQLPQVLAFHSALPVDGGAGALYVFLKKIQ